MLAGARRRPARRRTSRRWTTTSLTFLVIASFAAAMLGRLSSLPLTFVGAIALGLGSAYVQSYVHGSAYIQTGLQSSLPTFMLFAIAAVRAAGAAARRPGEGHPRRQRPVARGAVSAPAAGLVVAVLVVLQLLDPTDTTRFGIAIAYAIVMLSLVLLTGYGGYVSLAQFTFVGVGAAVVAKMNTTSPLAILFAGADRGGGGRGGRAAGAAAHRSLPRPGHARVRPADGQPGLPGRLHVRLRSASSTRSGCRCSATTSPAPAPTSSS